MSKLQTKEDKKTKPPEKTGGEDVYSNKIRMPQFFGGSS